jgi:hypothetical protein
MVTKTITQEGAIVGTLQYMAPEQLQGKAADARSDLFSFGCALYEMLTGKRAFEGASAPSVIAAVLEREPAPLEVSPPLERVVRRALAKDPEQRFQNARGLKTALEWAMEPQAVSAPRTSRRWQWIAATALVVGALVGAWAMAHLRPTARSRSGAADGHQPARRGPLRCHGQFGRRECVVARRQDGSIRGGHQRENRAVGEGSRRRTAPLLPGTEGAGSPFWSPDSKSIAFSAAGRLQRTDLQGGPPVTIFDVDATRGAAWGDDGQIVFGSLAGGLFRVSASGGTPSSLTHVDASSGEP